MKERGILSPWGLLRMGWIALQVCIVYWLFIPDQKELFQGIGGQMLPLKLGSWIHLPQTAFVLFTFACLYLLIRLFLQETSQDCALKQDMLKLGMRYSIAMLNIDFFKKFNDTYGHDTGDEVLKLVASLIKNVKGGGKAYRYGGEEFTILFPGRNVNDVMTSLEELRATIASRGFTVRRKRRTKNNNQGKSGNQGAKRRTAGIGSRSSVSTAYKKVSVHVSIGAANKDETKKTPDEVLTAADTALYRAKKKGRNCVSK